jgi:osmotically-inducible protein OsmY
LKKGLAIFLLGALLGASGVWYLEHGLHQQNFQAAREEMTREADQLRISLQNRFTNVTADAVRDELARTGMVVRDKATHIGHALMDATSDLRTTAALKANLLQVSGLSGLKINVDNSGGIVTLSGTLNSPEQVAEAVQTALQTEGVTKVISTIQVRPRP